MSEIKNYRSTNVDFFPILRNGGIILTSAVDMTRGTDSDEKIGNQIYVISLQLNYRIDLNESDKPNLSDMHPASNTVRWWLILDKQCNGNLPATTDILEWDRIDGFLNQDNGNRFVVLKYGYENIEAQVQTYSTFDAGTIISTAPIPAPSPVYSVKPSTTVHFYNQKRRVYNECNVKVNRYIEYDKTNFGGVNDIKTNNIFLYAIAEHDGLKMKVRTNVFYIDN